MNFLSDWLISHIKKSDMKYDPFLNERGVMWDTGAGRMKETGAWKMTLLRPHKRVASRQIMG
jgi:hypothetical protein